MGFLAELENDSIGAAMNDFSTIFNWALPMWSVAVFQVSAITLALLNRWEGQGTVAVTDRLGNLIDELPITHDPPFTSETLRRRFVSEGLIVKAADDRSEVVKTFQAWMSGLLLAAGVLLLSAFWVTNHSPASAPAELRTALQVLVWVAMLFSIIPAFLTLILAAGGQTVSALLAAFRELLRPRIS